MKILIVAGPYEADRIRRAAVSAGIEAVAVEPGESLSGWINATRPQVIVLQPQVINADPVAALAKVRSVQRGRVPILLVGEAADEAQLRPLADGFFVRPIAADDLIAQARAAMGAVPRFVDEGGSESQPQDGERGSDRTRAPSQSGPAGSAPVLRPLVAGRESGPVTDPASTREGPGGAVPGGLSPEGESSSRSAPSSARSRPTAMALTRLAETIEADMDADLAAELREVVRAVGARRAGRAGHDGATTGAPAALAAPSGPNVSDAATDAPDAAGELTDESSQKTREVPQVSPVSDRDEAMDRALVQARHALVLDGDYFQLLGVPRGAGADEIRRAHDLLSAGVTPAALHPSVAAELAPELDEIRVVLDEARALLENDRLRRQYREHLPAAAGFAGDAPLS